MIGRILVPNLLVLLMGIAPLVYIISLLFPLVTWAGGIYHVVILKCLSSLMGEG